MYSSKKQEQFYQTKRVRMMITHDHHTPDYEVIIQNMQTGTIERTWHHIGARFFTNGAWIDKHEFNRTNDHKTFSKEWYAEEERQRARIKANPYKHTGFYRKSNAVLIAQEQAVKLNLPFSMTTDIIDEKEAEHGPVHKCLICGDEEHHWNEFICDVCSNDARVARAQRAERGEYGIETQNLLEYGLSDYSGYLSDQSAELADDLLALATTTRGDQFSAYDSRREEHLKETIHYKGHKTDTYHRERTYRISLSDEQYKALVSLIDRISILRRDAYLTGHTNGSNLLDRLAKGELTPEGMVAEKDKVRKVLKGETE